MNQETLKKWGNLQNKVFTKNEFELMLTLYSGEHIKLSKDNIGKCKFLPDRKVPPQNSLIAKGMIERGMSGFKLTGPGIAKMEEIEKLVEKNKIQRCLYKLNQYPAAISLISTITGVVITLVSQYFSK